MPLSNSALRGFGFVHHSIALLYHQVPNPNLTIRNLCIAVRGQHRPQQLVAARPVARVDARAAAYPAETRLHARHASREHGAAERRVRGQPGSQPSP